jgi:tetratricopeptide (TPR) repeat protein
MPLHYLIYIWILFSSKVEISNISRVNRLITEAEESYKNGQFVLALVKYRYLINTLQLRDNNILLNLAHCYYLNNDKEQALKYYEQLAQSTDGGTGNIALQQLGVIAFEKKQYKKALDYFRRSLTLAPANEASRYNYELASRLIPVEDIKEKEPKKKNPEKEVPPPDTDNTLKQSETQSPEGQEQTETDNEQQQEIKRKLKQINLSEEKAKMILDAMKNSETQYIQQNKKQSLEKKDKNLPDW